jgi:hypothetical protein
MRSDLIFSTDRYEPKLARPQRGHRGPLLRSGLST